MRSRSSTSTITKNKAVKSVLLYINYLNLICDTTLSFLINVLTVTDKKAIVFGIICVFVRLIVKMMQIKFNYKENDKIKYYTVTPQTWTNKFYFFVCLVGCIVSVLVLFYNKIFSLSTISKEMGDSTFLHVLIFLVAIWAVLTSINSLFPAFWFNMSKANAREGRFYYHDGVFKKTELSKQETEGKFFRITPDEVEIKIDDNDVGQIYGFLNPNESKEVELPDILIINQLILLWSPKGDLFCRYNNKEQFWRRVKTIKIINEAVIIESFKLLEISEEKKSPLEELDKTTIDFEDNKKTVLSNWWSVRFFFRSVNVKILITFIDFLADLPFAIFTMHFSDLDPAIILFLKVCLPLGLVESMVYTLKYFSGDSYRNKIVNYQNVSKKARFCYYSLISCAYVSAFSKIFVKVVPMYHICYNIIHNKMTSAFLAFTLASVYMCRNLANVYNAEDSVGKEVFRLFNPKNIISQPPTPTPTPTNIN